MNHKLETFTMYVQSGGPSSTTVTMNSYPAYAPNAATWLTLCLIPIGVLASVGAVAFFALQRRAGKK